MAPVLTEETVGGYVALLASSAPAPGGGSAAALAGALGTALGEMAANFTVGRERFAAVQEDVARILGVLEAERARLLELTDQDAAAYGLVGAAYGMARGTAEEKAARAAAIQDALKAASEVPFGICGCCFSVAVVLGELAEKANPNLISDVGCAARLVSAAMDCGWLNCEINYASIRDEAFTAVRRHELGHWRAACAVLADETWADVVRAVCGAEG
jgi:methenyltetrahydrofolate cyclohydrolase